MNTEIRNNTGQKRFNNLRMDKPRTRRSNGFYPVFRKIKTNK